MVWTVAVPPREEVMSAGATVTASATWERGGIHSYAAATAFVCMSLAVAASADFLRPYGAGGQGQFVPIISQDFQLAPDGRAYTFSYSAGDGSQRQEQGVQRNTGTPAEAYSVTGSYSYTLPNGVPVQVNYVADEFGYQPNGPGVHPDIARAVAEQVAEARANPQIHSAYPALGYKRYR